MNALITSDELKSMTGEWDYSLLPKNVQLGAGCYLERKESFKRFRSAREPGLVLGGNVTVYTWTEFNVEPKALVEVGDGSVLVGVVFMCAEHIRIGCGAVVSYNVIIADSDFHPTDPALRRQDAISNAPYGDRADRPAFATKPVIIGDNVRIGIGAIILKGVHIGDRASIGAGAVVTHDVPAGAVMAGNPARPVERASQPHE